MKSICGECSSMGHVLTSVRFNKILNIECAIWPSLKRSNAILEDAMLITICPSRQSLSATILNKILFFSICASPFRKYILFSSPVTDVRIFQHAPYFHGSKFKLGLHSATIHYSKP